MKKIVSILLCVQLLNAATPQKMPQTSIRRIADVNNTGVLDKKTAINQYRNEITLAAEENKKIPTKNNSIFRVMSYNVHYWRNPADSHGAMNKILEVIQDLDPDLLILQEVSPSEGFAQGKHFTGGQSMQALKKLGYKEFSACNTVENGWFGNIIASKEKMIYFAREFFVGQKQNQSERRCYAKAGVKLPSGDNVLAYGTHLEVRDDNQQIRLAQIGQIIQEIDWNSPNSDVLIAADFNATRESAVVRLLQRAGYRDCFTYMGWQYPHFTTWAGTEIDFIFLSPKWDLPLAGCYVYFDAASDHLPVIMDIALDVQPQIQIVPTKAPRGDQQVKPDTNFLEELLQTVQRDLMWLAQVFNT